MGPVDASQVTQIPLEDATKAVAHPLRAKVLQLLDGETRSAGSIAGELDEHVGNISYHVGILRQLGAIRPMGKRSGIRSIQRLYTARWRVRVEADPVD